MDVEASLEADPVRLPVGFPDLPSSWKWVPLAQSCAGIYDCPHSTPELTNSGPYLVRTQDYPDGVLKLDGMARVSEETYADRVRRAVPQRGDILYSREGSYHGIAAEVPDGHRVCMGQRMVLIRPDRKMLNFRFLRYWLNSSYVRDFIAGMREGSGAPRINMPTIRELLVPAPPIDEQNSVARLLGALDDKIAVNERIAATTDNLVSAMFEELLFLHEVAGEVVLGDIAAVNQESIKGVQEGVLRYVDISSVGVGSYEWPELTSWESAPGRARRKARVGDTLWSTVRPNRRSHAFVLDSDSDLVFSTGLAVLTPKSVGAAFLYEVTKRPAFQAYLESVAEGSTYPAVRADRFKQAPIPAVPAAQRDNFEEIAMALRLRAHEAARESRALATLRDTLLPQLMSGRLRVKDAEKNVEEQV